MRVLCVIGTRPEAIKMAPIITRLRSLSGQVELCVCATAQHRDMLDQVLELFHIVPEVDLDLMQPDQSPCQLASRVLHEMEPILRAQKPDWMLVQGDTTTAMASAIAAHYGRVRVAHVEAGLRTFDRSNPFPEEANRVIVDQLSDLHFAPTARARQNLLREGIRPEGVFVTGNTVIDALLWVSARLPSSGTQDQLARPGLDKRAERLLLVTAHRRESFGVPLANICMALRALAKRKDVKIIYPVHQNPNVRETVQRLLSAIPGVVLLPPTDYRTWVELMRRSTVILTDSGGVQEEAPTLGIPVLVMRETTERPEAVEAGAARLIGTDPDRIVAETERLLDDPAAYSLMAKATNPYGDGRAAERIVSLLLGGSCEEYCWHG